MEKYSQVIEEKWLGRISYSEALEIQNRFVTDRLENKVNDTILLLEHEPVYTIGRTRDKSSLQKEALDLPYPVFETNRGGQATYHGPGQLVGYPILDLKLYKKDLHIYLRSLEKALIDACNQFKIKATTRKGLTGVWCSNRKIASIGVGVRRWISMHGFAINVSGDLSPFKEIIPCGISDAEMTSIHNESSNKVSVKDFSTVVSKSIKNELLNLLEK
jgi:lipoyl(octanoyl) transferase